ncbi:glucosaminidase domain-containing protein [Pseudolactococcus piscium]|nr:glucosaminidase domain-containing protein [Lactococcus piscium]
MNHSKHREKQRSIQIVGAIVLVIGMFISIKVSASDVNDYIIRNNIKPAAEELQLGRIYNQDSSKNGNINMNYDGGKPQMIVIHDIGVDGGNINGSIDYMVRTQDSAFVHAFVDDSRLITIADKNKKSWGSGAYGNKYGIQIEQIRVAGYTAFYKQIATLANWTAQQMDQYDMGAPKLMSSPSTPQTNDLSIRPDGNLTTHKMLSYKFNQTTNHVDPDAYWARFGYDINQFRDLVSKYYNDIKTKQNIGYLDSVGITGEGNSIKVRGWHYSSKKYEYLFIMDANTGREISRQQVTTPDIRTDIKNVYNYPNIEKSGFNVTLPTPQGRDVYIMSRKTDDTRGDDVGGADDIRFTSNPITTFANRGYLDSSSLTGNTLAMRAWFWAGQSYKYQFLFALDANTGRELSRKSVNIETRSDVKRALNNLDNSEKSGIQDQLEVPIDKTIIMMIRRTNDPKGDEIGGKSDYTFADTTISSYKAKSDQDSLSINDTVLNTRGWFWTESRTYQYQYVFVMDKNTNQELARKVTPIVSRPDVKNYLGNFATADMTGFDVSMEVPSNKQAYIMVRRTNDPKGDELGGFTQVSYTNNVVNTKTAPEPQDDRPSQTPNIDLTGTNDTQKTWFNALYASAQQLAKANDLFPSVMMSQAIAESAWGQSELAKTGNNLFGVKADPSWTGAVVSRLTAENTTAANQTVTGYRTESEGRSGNPATTFVLANKGTAYYIYANFRKYASQSESLRDYVTKIKTTVNGSSYRYQGAWRSNAGSYQNAARALKAGGYATDPDYAINLINRIDKYKLNALD